MISALATMITNRLCVAAAIEEVDRELYIYGLFILISRVFFLLVSVFCGLLLGIILESVLFYMMFTLLRSYAGGVHAKTENMCSILTTFSLFVSICGIKAMTCLRLETISLVIMSIGTVCIIALCPLDTAEKPLEGADLRHYRHTSIIIVAVYFMLGLLMYALGWNGILNTVAVSVALEAILMVFGKIMQV